MASQNLASRRRVLFTDGEGPLVFKDLAADITEKVVPGLFPVLSFYDDYLAEVGTEGYQAGDTLALVVPDLLLHGVRDEDVANEAKDAKVCFGVKDYITGLKRDGWNVRIISTAYSQLWELVGRYLGIPMQDIACTNLDLKTLREKFGFPAFLNSVQDAEKQILGLVPLAKQAMEEVDNGKPIVRVLEDDNKFSPLLKTLNDFYWKNLPEMGYKTLEAVTVIGGKRKVEAAKRFAKELSVPISNVAYVGDSITDDEMHKFLSKEGGLPIAINGNTYAIRKARIAVATTDMKDLRPILDKWADKGFGGVRKLIESSSANSYVGGKEGQPIPENEGFYYHMVEGASPEQMKNILATHKIFRKLVRGPAAALG